MRKIQFSYPINAVVYLDDNQLTDQKFSRKLKRMIQSSIKKYRSKCKQKCKQITIEIKTVISKLKKRKFFQVIVTVIVIFISTEKFQYNTNAGKINEPVDFNSEKISVHTILPSGTSIFEINGGANFFKIPEIGKTEAQKQVNLNGHFKSSKITKEETSHHLTKSSINAILQNLRKESTLKKDIENKLTKSDNDLSFNKKIIKNEKQVRSVMLKFSDALVKRLLTNLVTDLAAELATAENLNDSEKLKIEIAKDVKPLKAETRIAINDFESRLLKEQEKLQTTLANEQILGESKIPVSLTKSAIQANKNLTKSAANKKLTSLSSSSSPSSSPSNQRFGAKPSAQNFKTNHMIPGVYGFKSQQNVYNPGTLARKSPFNGRSHFIETVNQKTWTALEARKGSAESKVYQLETCDGRKWGLTDKSSSHLVSNHGHDIGINDLLPVNPNQKLSKYPSKNLRTRVNEENKRIFRNTLQEYLLDLDTDVRRGITIRGQEGIGYLTTKHPGDTKWYFMGGPIEGPLKNNILRAQGISPQQYEILITQNRID
jgi:hypothetical protein